MQLKFEKFIESKIIKNIIKSDLIKEFQIIKNNYTLYSNVINLKFDLGNTFNYKENDSIEKRIKYIYNYLNYEVNISNIYFEKINEVYCHFPHASKKCLN